MERVVGSVGTNIEYSLFIPSEETSSLGMDILGKFSVSYSYNALEKFSCMMHIVGTYLPGRVVLNHYVGKRSSWSFLRDFHPTRTKMLTSELTNLTISLIRRG